MTIVQFESILLRQNEIQTQNQAFCFDRTPEGSSGCGVKLLPLAQYGRLKCVTVVQFERSRTRERRVNSLPLAQYGKLKCVTVVQFESRRGEGTRSQFLTAGSVWEAEMCDNCAV